MHRDVPASVGPLERCDRGLALEENLGQDVDDVLRGVFVCQREARAVGGGCEGHVTSS